VALAEVDGRLRGVELHDVRCAAAELFIDWLGVSEDGLAEDLPVGDEKGSDDGISHDQSAE
jgi:hypothetical protein